MQGKRKHIFDILNIFTMIIYRIQKAPISTLIKIIYLKVKYFFIYSIHVPESALPSQNKFTFLYLREIGNLFAEEFHYETYLHK